VVARRVGPVKKRKAALGEGGTVAVEHDPKPEHKVASP